MNKFAYCPDTASLWKELSRHGFNKPDQLSPFTYFTSNQLNEFFTGIHNVSLPCDYFHFLDEIEKISRGQHEFEFAGVTLDAIEMLMRMTKSGPGEGPDGLSLYALKATGPVLASNLVVLFNNSFLPCHFPSD